MSDLLDHPQRRVSDAGLVGKIVNLHNAVFGTIERLASGWFTGLLARFTFASVLFWYYMNSGLLKLGDGFFGFLNPSFGAFASILPPIVEKAGGDPAAIAFFPWHIIVLLGTWAEIILPVLLVLGLFSRIAAIGMIIFVIVQSYVDIVYHELGERFIGSMFDRFQDAIIFDQRLMWVMFLLLIVVNGPGKISLDHLLGRIFRK